MSANEAEIASIQRASQRTAWAAKALAAAADDLYVAHASKAGDVLADEADRLVELGAEVSKLAKAGAGSR